MNNLVENKVCDESFSSPLYFEQRQYLMKNSDKVYNSYARALCRLCNCVSETN